MSSSERKFMVLYVEDEENDVLLLEYAWRQAAVEERLEVVKNGKEALSYFQREKAAYRGHEFPRRLLLLLDLNLPQVTGFELLSWVRKHEHLKRLPVIILTSSNQKQDIQLAYELGVNAYLIKPSNLDALVALVRSIKDFWLERNIFPDNVP